MYPTLHIGDYDLASKFAYGYSLASLPLLNPRSGDPRFLGRLPKRGDIVVFRWPGDPRTKWVKRVIGLPGDTVAVHNGIAQIVSEGPTQIAPVALTDPCELPNCRYLAEQLPGAPPHHIALLDHIARRRSMAPITIPSDMLFVMGDNRDTSLDSRLTTADGGAGLVPLSHLEGKVVLIAGNPFEMSRFFKLP